MKQHDTFKDLKLICFGSRINCKGERTHKLKVERQQWIYHKNLYSILALYLSSEVTCVFSEHNLEFARLLPISDTYTFDPKIYLDLFDSLTCLILGMDSMAITDLHSQQQCLKVQWILKSFYFIMNLFIQSASRTGICCFSIFFIVLLEK